ncbi:MAG: DNA oxidative demethylase AlkB [Pseudomonadota bacterium]
MTDDLFGEPVRRDHEMLGPGALLLHGFALAEQDAVLAAVSAVIAAAPLRHMITPGGFRMSVAITNCGHLGWISDRRGYRYSSLDPETSQPWPTMSDALLTLAQRAATEAGYANFTPDACLINRYVPGARMTLHQDRNEHDFNHPIVSVSLGLPAMFQLGGLQRSDKTLRVPLQHGDVLVWGGSSRLRFHGVLPLKAGQHDVLGEQRINLTFRCAG